MLDVAAIRNHQDPPRLKKLYAKLALKLQAIQYHLPSSRTQMTWTQRDTDTNVRDTEILDTK